MMTMKYVTLIAATVMLETAPCYGSNGKLRWTCYNKIRPVVQRVLPSQFDSMETGRFNATSAG